MTNPVYIRHLHTFGVIDGTICYGLSGDRYVEHRITLADGRSVLVHAEDVYPADNVAVLPPRFAVMARQIDGVA